MGILNITPDSFYNKSRVTENQIVDVAGHMLEDGASMLDLGAQSTRPGATLISESEESARLCPAISAIKKHLPDAWISADTFYAVVARDAVSSGADIINDISAGDDDSAMLSVVSKMQVPYIAMHKKGVPATMQQNPQYENVYTEVLTYFVAKQAQLRAEGIFDWVLDPGIGFGKTVEHNFNLLQNLSGFQIFERPLLIGVSRKGLIQKTLNVDASGALNGTTALNMFSLTKGAAILRVHDVKEAVDCVKLWQALKIQT